MHPTVRTARLAGLLYVLLGAACLLGILHAPLVLEDITAIAREISAPSDLRFRVAIVSDLLSNVIGIGLVMLLYRLLAPVGRSLAALMAILLLIAVPISLLISLNDVAARMLLRDDGGFASSMAAADRDALAMLFVRLHVHGVFAVEIFWGLWLFPFGVLVYRSRFLPRTLGVLLVISGCAYTIHSLVSLLVPGPHPRWYWVTTMVGRGVGELPIMLWLLIRGAAVDAQHGSGAPASRSAMAGE
jgi:hypothetical protein